MTSGLVIDSQPGERRVALVEDDQLVELHVERALNRPLAGNIYLGRVRNVLPGMQAAFVDLGLERDGFLHVDDAPGAARLRAEWIGVDAEGEPETVGPVPRIEERVREGEDLILQVVKDPLARKGPRVSAQLSIPGRLVVLLPGVAHLGVSRRIPDEDERLRLRGVLHELHGRIGPPGGLILRTAGAEAAPQALEEEIRTLAETWRGIQARRAAAKAPALLYEEAGVVERVLREQLRHGVEEIAVDSDEVLEEVRRALARLGGTEPRLVRHAGGESLFDTRRLTAQIDRALRARVWLPSGGHIAIHPTEALVAVDVNTGKYVGRGDLEETLLRTNLEAVREIARQIRLRDLGGLIVIDFIDMERPESREAVLRELSEKLQRDRARNRMLPMSDFGLVEITRQRSRPSLDRQLLRACPACDGAGRVRSLATLQHEVVRQARRLGARGEGTIVARLAPEAAAGLRSQIPQIARALGGLDPGRLAVEADPQMGPDDVLVVER